ncbi:MAG: hypothetical protein KAQ79_02135, partial [Cyclobacteriaceae bacterium]|nr:hypothetical protein [Cyclobacteriaceae bacterium]
NLYDPVWRGVHGVAIGNSPAGPFKALDEFVFDIKMKNGKIASAEDPYVWYNKKESQFHAIIKDFSGRITGHGPGLGRLISNDGLKWELPDNPLFMKKELLLKDGGTLKVNRLERPQLLIDEEGNPKVLYVACAIENVNQKKDGSSFNVQINLNK